MAHICMAPQDGNLISYNVHNKRQEWRLSLVVIELYQTKARLFLVVVKLVQAVSCCIKVINVYQDYYK